MHLYSMPRSKLAVSRGTKSLGSPWSDICHMLARNHIQIRALNFLSLKVFGNPIHRTRTPYTYSESFQYYELL